MSLTRANKFYPNLESRVVQARPTVLLWNWPDLGCFLLLSKKYFMSPLITPRQKLHHVKNHQPAKMALFSHYCLPEAIWNYVQIFPRCSFPLGEFGFFISLNIPESQGLQNTLSNGAGWKILQVQLGYFAMIFFPGKNCEAIVLSSNNSLGPFMGY